MRYLVLLLALSAACRSTAVGPYTPLGEGARETTLAEKLNREAADLIATDPARAEAILREALTKDLFCGSAHNNLGVVFLGQDKLYEAANEFEWARRLMPGQPDPHVNLALTMERAGRNADASQSYEAALESCQEYMPAIQGLASLTLRARRDDPRLAGWLERIALEGEGQAWREWAREQATRGHRPRSSRPRRARHRGCHGSAGLLRPALAPAAAFDRARQPGAAGAHKGGVLPAARAPAVDPQFRERAYARSAARRPRSKAK